MLKKNAASLNLLPNCFASQEVVRQDIDFSLPGKPVRLSTQITCISLVNRRKITIINLIEMNNKKSWGKSLAIDLYDCDHELLLDRRALRHFVQELVAVIKMQLHGPCRIDRFGSGSLHGLSAMQFIETSCVTVHLDDKGDRAFVDIFSCKDFDTNVARRFAREFYKAKRIKTTALTR